jgi:hypothetical protein
MAQTKITAKALDEPARKILEIPAGLKPYFQEYDVSALDPQSAADLVIQRTLEFGTWNEVRWLFGFYGYPRIRIFIRQRGERTLSPVAFNYWRKLFKVERWQGSPFPTPKGEIWRT